MTESFVQELPFGAALGPDGSTRFRLWAPSAGQVRLELDGADAGALSAIGGGWFEAERPAGAGARYRFLLPDGVAVPDPASRAQQTDVHGASLVVDPRAYAWRHGDWRNRPWHEAVIYELHVGVMGGFDAVRADLPRLAALGVTAIELMPVADFPGRRNWGYDGVLPFAPDAAYGTPDQLKALIDAAHGLGLMVLLDVVYNHFGPDGAYLHVYAKEFFDAAVQTPWGAAIDFKRPEVQQFFVQNALYWLNEYRFDGLRFDAVHAIAPQGFLPLLADGIRAGVDRPVHLVLEHEGNVASLLRAAPDAPGFDAQWADDWHHCLHVLLTGESEGYYEGFQSPARQLACALEQGFVYQGEFSPHHGAPRGEPSAHLPPSAFVVSLQTHDQIGNRAFGERLSHLAHPDALTAATALLLLCPFVPMLFMGEEFATSAPFLFFTDHNDELAAAVRDGRRREFQHFAAFADARTCDTIPDPNAPGSFMQSVPDWREMGVAPHADILAVHKQLLALRHRHVTPGIAGCRSLGAAELSGTAVRATWRLGSGGVLTLVANFGTETVRCARPDGEVIFGDWIGPGTAPRRTVAFLRDAAA